jgi:hypothetical protein
MKLIPILLPISLFSLACGSPNTSVTAAANAKTAMTCTVENAVANAEVPIDLKFVINMTNGARTSLVCSVLDFSTKAVLTLKETDFASETSCQFYYKIAENDTSAAWVFSDGSTSDYATYSYAASTFNNTTVVFDAADCSTVNVD